MSYDNRIFNVNGEGDEALLATLKLAFTQADHSDCAGYEINAEKGLVLLWYCSGEAKTQIPFPFPLNAEECFPIVRRWLKSSSAAAMPCEGEDADAEHDGSNGPGWRVYCERWGHVGGSCAAICAVRPVYLWYGK